MLNNNKHYVYDHLTLFLSVIKYSARSQNKKKLQITSKRKRERDREPQEETFSSIFFFVQKLKLKPATNQLYIEIKEKKKIQ